MKEKELIEKEQKKKGISFDANIKQLLVAGFLIFVMLVLPIYFYENADSNIITDFINSQQNPYSSEAIADRGGQVAGASTYRPSATDSTLSVPLINREINLNQLNQENRPILLGGIVVVASAFFVSLYFLLGKLEE